MTKHVAPHTINVPLCHRKEADILNHNPALGVLPVDTCISLMVRVYDYYLCFQNTMNPRRALSPFTYTYF